MTILLTGTHLTPALATIQALRRKAPDARLVYVGRKYTGAAESVEKEETEREGVEFKTLTFGKFHRYFTWRQILELAKFPVGFWQAGKLILELKPDVVVSFGGYVALPAAIWGKLIGAKLIVHEQTTEWGLANRLLRPVADVTVVSWKEMAEPGTVWTGNPIRGEVLRAADPRRHFFDTLDPGRDSGAFFSGDARLRDTSPGAGRLKPRSLKVRPIRELVSNSRLDVTGSLFPGKKVPSSRQNGFPVLYITGGNQGAKAVDEVVAKILPDLVDKFEVFHQTKSKINFKHPRYHPAEWFSTPIHADILSRAAVSVSRAGANTVAELMYLGIPSILIPLPDSAGGEQEKNAEIIAGTGLGKIIKQGDLSADGLLGAIGELARGSGPRPEERLVGGLDVVPADFSSEKSGPVRKGNTAADKLAELILGEKE